MCPEWDIDRDCRSSQFCESLGIQNQEESAFLLHVETDMGNVTYAVSNFLSIFVKAKVQGYHLISFSCG